MLQDYAFLSQQTGSISLRQYCKWQESHVLTVLSPDRVFFPDLGNVHTGTAQHLQTGLAFENRTILGLHHAHSAGQGCKKMHKSRIMSNREMTSDVTDSLLQGSGFGLLSRSIGTLHADINNRAARTTLSKASLIN
eukprot:765489-Hanusia_phi.AAC.1